MEIKALLEACSRREPLNMKLNWNMLEERPADEENDLLCYDEGKLIGYMGLYHMEKSSTEIEVTGMVHPDYRRQGIFKELYNTARQKCAERGAEKILLISERCSEAGRAFAESAGGQHVSSEYKMRFEGQTVPDFPSVGIALRTAEPRDYSRLVALDRVCFGLPEGEMDEDYCRQAYESTFVADLEGEMVGKIGVLVEGQEGYIFGVGVKPEYRGRGYGREILSLAMLDLLARRINSTFLEVAVANERALTLYKSSGFKENSIYNYYEIGL